MNTLNQQQTPNIFNQNYLQQAQNIFKTPSQQPQDSKNSSKGDDKIAFLEKRREMYLHHQKQDRDNILNRSRILLQNFKKSGKIDQTEEQQLEKQQKKQNESLENLFQSFEFSNNNNNSSQNTQNSIELQQNQNQTDQNQTENTNIANQNSNETIEEEERRPIRKLSQTPQLKEDKIPKTIKSKTSKKQNKSFASLLVQPEFMIDIPLSLFQNYFLIPKPYGQRALVYIQQGYAICRDKNGILFSKFKTQMKNGSVLDCIYQKNEQQFIVMDALQLGKLELQGEPTELRQHFMQQEFEQYKSEYEELKNEKKFLLAPCFQCTKETLRQCYCSHYPYLKEGLLFVHKETQYIGGLHPNYLLFKDQFCSMYPIEMAPEIQDNEQLVFAVLELDYNTQYQNENINTQMAIEQKMYQLQTVDKVQICQISEEEFNQGGYKLGNLVKVVIRKIEIANECQDRMEFDDNLDSSFNSENLNNEINVSVKGLKIVGKSSNYKCFSDPLSKIIFQYKIRHDPIKYDDIFNSVAKIQDQVIQNSMAQE